MVEFCNIEGFKIIWLETRKILDNFFYEEILNISLWKLNFIFYFEQYGDTKLVVKFELKFLIKHYIKWCEITCRILIHNVFFYKYCGNWNDKWLRMTDLLWAWINPKSIFNIFGCILMPCLQSYDRNYKELDNIHTGHSFRAKREP